MALTTPFAQNGDKKAIPQNTSDGSVSFDRGFGSFYALPPEEGGLFIDRAQFNQLMFDTTSEILANKQSLNNVSNSTYNKNEVDNLINVKANWNAVVNLTGDQTIAGVKTFTSNITAPNITAMQNNLNTIFSPTSSPVKAQTTSKTITVGTGGNFQDLESAINEAKKYTSQVHITLVSDLQISQDMFIHLVNGNHIAIEFGNYKLINTSSKIVNLYITGSSIGSILNLKLENINFIIGTCSSVALTGVLSINVNIESIYSPLLVSQSSLLSFTTDSQLTINGFNNLITSSIGGILSFSNATINTSTQTGNLISIHNGGIITLYQQIKINKPSSLNMFNVAINTPSESGLILASSTIA